MTTNQPGINKSTDLDRAFATAVEAATNINTLQELVQTVVVSLLRRADDLPLRQRTLATVSAYFSRMRAVEGMSPRDKLAHLRLFSRETIQIVLTQRPLIGRDRPVPTPAPAEMPRRRASDHGAAALPPAPAPVPDLPLPDLPLPDLPLPDLTDERLSAVDVEQPTAIHQPEPPRPQTFASFRALFPAALRYRLCSLTRFFQRGNGQVRRDLVRPFLLAPEFEARFMTVVDTIIVPKMFALSRNLSALETSRKWDEVSTADFWTVLVENERTRISVTSAWQEAWGSCRQRETQRTVQGQTKTVLVAQPELKKIREMLTPDHPGIYDIPQVRNPEIDLFVALLTEFDLTQLEYCFTKLRQMYEQELDPRWYQDRARSGALRDSLLQSIESLPDRAGDFVALLCYYCFPNADLFFLERFTHNKGATDAARTGRLPYLMRFLSGERVAEMRERERRERRERDGAEDRREIRLYG